MVKLHYVNRKSEGVKLGQVIAKDVLKRIPPGANHKAALRDPCVDLDVSGKGLTDAGLQEAISALVTSMGCTTEHGKVVILEEVCLKGNKLTARCLRALARVITLAAADLRDLDLSENLITIATDEDAIAWADFLDAFANCCVLRRIDLSGNLLGPKAFELLARVYRTQEIRGRRAVSDPSTSILEESGDINCSSDGLDSLNQAARKLRMKSSSRESILTHNDHRELVSTVRKNSRQESDSSGEQPNTGSIIAPHPHHYYERTRGLQSIPYFIFSATSMDDTAALHLSYIVARHGQTHELLTHIPQAKAGHPALQLEAYDMVHGCNGIIYRPNDTIGSAGTKVLELAEQLREAPIAVTVESSNLAVPSSPTTPTNAQCRGSDAWLLQHPEHTGVRRRSTVSMDACDPNIAVSSSSRTTELNRARSRIQGDSLRDNGPRSNDLWFASLKMLSVARIILLEPSQQVQIQHNKKRSQDFARMLSQPPLTNHVWTPRPERPWTTPLSLANPNRAVVPQMPQRGKGSVTRFGSTTTSLGSPLSAESIVRPSAPPMSKRDRSYRIPLFRRLNDKVWSRIITFACGGTGIVHTEQALSIVKWAKDRGTLEREMEALGKAESAQIWKVLEGMGCLAYGAIEEP